MYDPRYVLIEFDCILQPHNQVVTNHTDALSSILTDFRTAVECHELQEDLQLLFGRLASPSSTAALRNQHRDDQWQ